VKIRYNSPVILSFALISGIVLLINTYLNYSFAYDFFCVYSCSLKNPVAYFRFFSHVLGHTSFSHYSSNMLLMLLVGPSIEEKYGSTTLTELILVTAFLTGIINFFVFPNSALMGASGIVFMMIVLSSFSSTRKGGIPLTLILVLICYIGNEIVNGISLTDNVSQLTHILGGLLGMIYGFILNKRHNQY